MRLHQLIVRGQASKSATPTSDDGKASALSRKLSRLERGLKSTHDTTLALTSDPSDHSLLEQYREQLADYKKDLAAVYEDLLVLEVGDDDERLGVHSKLEKLSFECSHQLKKLLAFRSSDLTSTLPSESSGVKLPKLDVPTFDGNTLNWKQFCEQFTVSVHNKSSLSNAEKLVYLQQAIKDGRAKGSIEGLSCSGDHYVDAEFSGEMESLLDQIGASITLEEYANCDHELDTCQPLEKDWEENLLATLREEESSAVLEDETDMEAADPNTMPVVTVKTAANYMYLQELRDYAMAQESPELLELITRSQTIVEETMFKKATKQTKITDYIEK